MIVQYPQKEFAQGLTRILRLKGLGAGSRILDIPCGNGETADLLAKNGTWNVEGYDLSVGSIGHARSLYRRVNLRFADGDIHAILGRESGISAICIVNSLFLLDRREELIDTAYRSLVNGGILALIIPNISGFNYRSFKRSSPGVNKIEMDLADLQHMLKNHGYTVISAEGICFAPLYGRPLIRYLSVLAPLYLRLENKIRKALSMGSPSYYLVTATKS